MSQEIIEVFSSQEIKIEPVDIIEILSSQDTEPFEALIQPEIEILETFNKNPILESAAPQMNTAKNYRPKRLLNLKNNSRVLRSTPVDVVKTSESNQIPSTSAIIKTKIPSAKKVAMKRKPEAKKRKIVAAKASTTKVSKTASPAPKKRKTVTPRAPTKMVVQKKKKILRKKANKKPLKKIGKQVAGKRAKKA